MKKLLMLAAVLMIVPVLMGSLVTREQVSTAVAIDDDLVTGTIALTASSVQYTLPQRGDPYMICANGNTAFVECGTNPTVATGAGNYTFFVPEGGCIGPVVLRSMKCAQIASSAAGQIVNIHFDPDI